MKVIGYAYDADYHCPHCAQRDAACGILKRYPPLKMGTDGNGLALDLIDREGNPVHPVFSTDEAIGGEDHPVCGECGEPF